MKHIKLTDKIGKYTDGTEYLSVSEDLQFQIDHKFNAKAEVYFTANNGSTVRQGIVKDNQFTLPISFLRLGRLSLKIEENIAGQVKTYNVEDLLILKSDNKIETIPEVEKLKNEIAVYSKLVEKLERKNEILTKLVGGLYDTEIKVDNENG